LGTGLEAGIRYMLRRACRLKIYTNSSRWLLFTC
jgi:hypothetical protein